MENAPNLIIELKRMGDLVLSFPLMSMLQATDQAREVWVLAKPEFYQGLLPLAPDVVFFSPDSIANLARTKFNNIINLSSNPEACNLLTTSKAEQKYGLCYDSQNNLHILGTWHLYRHSIIHNNRHNFFHFSDLPYLEFMQNSTQKIIWPQIKKNHNGKIGLFVGASEEAKRPHANFWSELAMILVKKGLHPVFLGGPEDRATAQQAARQAKMPHSNLAGHFSLAEFTKFCAHLDILVTPDTGPMHVCSWMGIPTLNLSMGPVNAWETAPAAPGHYVLRTSASCVGCWQCRVQSSPAPCHQAFIPHRIATLLLSILQNKTTPLLPGLNLFKTSRRPNNLFSLSPQHEQTINLRNILGEFWQQAFLLINKQGEHNFSAQAAMLAHNYPQIYIHLVHSLTKLRHKIISIRRTGQIFAKDDWKIFPPLLRPLASFIQLNLENEDYSKNSQARCLNYILELLTYLNEK